jgi:hypothetical protein
MYKLLLAILPLLFIGCGGGSAGTRANPQPIYQSRSDSYYRVVQDGERIPTQDGQTVSVEGDNNNVKAIVAEDGSTVVYCEAGATCTVVINSEVNNNTGGVVNEDLNEDLKDIN